MKFKEIDIEEFKTRYLSNQSKEVAVEYRIAPSTVAGWARKLDLPRKSFTYLNENIELSKQQLEVLTGSLLGDGSLNKIKPNTNCQSHYEETHSEHQLGWLTWKHEILKPLSTNIFRKTKKGLQKCNGKIIYDENKTHEHHGFSTIKHPTFTELEKKWYKRDKNGNYIYRISKGKKYRIKIVPEFELTPFILAVWYIDDGSNHQETKSCKFSTQSFTKKEVKILLDKIKALGIHDCHINPHSNAFIIVVGTYSYLDFINMVKEQLPDLSQDVQYKIDLSEYNPATKWSDNKTGIPFFRMEGKKYSGTVMIDYKAIYLGSYDFKTANKVSKEVEHLVRHKCKEPAKYIEIKNKYATSVE